VDLNTTADIIEDIRQGKMVILMDDEDRENEGDLIMAAEKVRPEDINFMARHARGLICLTLTEARCRQLGLPLMVAESHASHGTNFTVSIEAAEGVTTGISAADRARTIQAAVAKNATSKDIVQPGHIFPVMAQPGGVLTRAGHTEAGCDLARLAGFEPAAAIVEIMNDDGTMAINERQVQTLYGDFTLKTYLDSARSERHFALIKGTLVPDEPILVRVHVGSTARDLMALWPNRDAEAKPWTCQGALQHIAAEGRGVVVLICHNETTCEIEESIDWIMTGKPRSPSRQLAYKQVGTGSQILQDLGIHKMRLMSAPYKFNAISGFNLEVVEYIPNT
jgi:3,4-dihydroxy 2-butanone 4-phosphate synthase / GTP cyclohydrolase II